MEADHVSGQPVERRLCLDEVSRWVNPEGVASNAVRDANAGMQPLQGWTIERRIQPRVRRCASTLGFGM
jgi:hypothetical protein